MRMAYWKLLSAMKIFFNIKSAAIKVVGQMLPYQLLKCSFSTFHRLYAEIIHIIRNLLFAYTLFPDVTHHEKNAALPD